MPRKNQGLSPRGKMRRNFEQEPVPSRPIPLELDVVEGPVYESGFANEAMTLAMFGYMDSEIAKWFGITTKQLNQWKSEHPEFERAIEQSEAVLHGEALTTIRTWALKGYTTEEIMMSRDDETGEYVPGNMKVRKLPPSLDAAKFLAEATAPSRYGKLANMIDGQAVALTGEALKATINQIMGRIPTVVESVKKPLPPAKKVSRE